jgi:hypothetical protein
MQRCLILFIVICIQVLTSQYHRDLILVTCSLSWLIITAKLKKPINKVTPLSPRLSVNDHESWIHIFLIRTPRLSWIGPFNFFSSLILIGNIYVQYITQFHLVDHYHRPSPCRRLTPFLKTIGDNLSMNHVTKMDQYFQNNSNNNFPIQPILARDFLSLSYRHLLQNNG